MCGIDVSFYSFSFSFHDFFVSLIVQVMCEQLNIMYRNNLCSAGSKEIPSGGKVQSEIKVHDTKRATKQVHEILPGHHAWSLSMASMRSLIALISDNLSPLCCFLFLGGFLACDPQLVAGDIEVLAFNVLERRAGKVGGGDAESAAFVIFAFEPAWAANGVAVRAEMAAMTGGAERKAADAEAFGDAGNEFVLSSSSRLIIVTAITGLEKDQRKAARKTITHTSIAFNVRLE